MILCATVKTVKDLDLYALLFNVLCSWSSISKATIIEVILKKCSWRKEVVDYSQSAVTVIQFNKDGYEQYSEWGVNPGHSVANAAL